jgi:ketosteroid isomerase-like protein
MALFLLVILIMPQYALADVNVSQQELKAIVRTREIALQALNTRDFAKIKPYLHPNFTIVTVDNRIFHNADEFETYWNQQFSGPVKNITMEMKDDTSRTFLSPETEVAYGEAISTFSFTDGNQATMAMRWTAVLQKLQDKWTIQSLHFSSNLLDNPVLSAAKQLVRTVGIVAGVGGFLLGAVVMLLFRRKSKQLTKTVD